MPLMGVGICFSQQGALGRNRKSQQHVLVIKPSCLCNLAKLERGLQVLYRSMAVIHSCRFAPCSTKMAPGLQVFYKVTEFMDDQILMTGFAPGGLSQAPQSFFRTASLSAPLAQEQGIFGIKPEVLWHL